jgi:DNA-binding NarL/FixJ family response regulator
MSPRPDIRVLLISPRALIRQGLAALLRDQPQIHVVGSLPAPDDTRVDCDVTLWDVADSPVRPLAARYLVLLDAHARPIEWLGAGALGCVFVTSTLEELLSALRQVARGEPFIPSSLLPQLLHSATTVPATHLDAVESLSERERDVLRLLAQGLSNKDIAQKLYLSVRTVEGHLANIYAKLQVKSRTEAALLAVQHGWLDG